MGQCTAKSKRSQQRCKRNCAPGKTVCYFHGAGGGSKPGDKRAFTHGIYTDGLLDEEKPLWEKIEIKTLDDEIRMVSMQLRRAVTAQKLYILAKEEGESVADSLELQELIVEVGQGPKGPINIKRLLCRKRDFTYEIDRLTGRLGDLITKNAALKGEEIDAREKARQIKEALEAIEANADGHDA
jgi:hypothetical protein